MYDFIDITQAQANPADSYPSEAMKINGQYLEDLVPGYRTLTVSGRETFLPELETQNTAARNGAIIKNRRYPARELRITYQITAAGNADFRAAFNALNQALNVENATLIFADEPDKFFVGTPSGAGDVTPGQNAVTGEFTVLCADPLKYSTTPKTATVAPGESSVQIQYNGTAPASPIIDVVFFTPGITEGPLPDNAGDCGFVSVSDTDGHLLKFGNSDEEDTDPSQPGSQETLFNQAFTRSTSWSEDERAPWKINAVPEQWLSNVQDGSLALLNEKQVMNRYLGPESYGTNSDTSHGPSMMRDIPADASGETDCSLWAFSFQPVFRGNNLLQQYGEFAAIVFDADGNWIAGVRLVKKYIGSQGIIEFYAQDDMIYTGSIDVENGPFANHLVSENAWISIERTAEAITFRAPEVTRSYNTSSISSAAKVVFMFSQIQNKPALDRNGLAAVKFIKRHPGNIPNTFASKDHLQADCHDAKILLNNTPRPDIGEIGNDWEDFSIQPGENRIFFEYSDWVPDSYAPTLHINYREAYL